MSSETDSASSEALDKQYHAPEWAKHVVWYQIFPERFCNGDPSNDPVRQRVAGDKQIPENWAISPWTGDWYERADWEREMGPEFRDSVFFRRYGGDIQGIIDKLDYLQELGITAIYLNPVFDAVSLHKYDTSSFRHVDRFFGPDPEGDTAIIEEEDPEDPSTWQWTAADRLFLELVEEIHRRGMRIIIDAVFNHTGTDFWAFRDVADRQQQSEFRGWYDIISFENGREGEETEFDYHSWWGIKDLPELRQKDGNLVEPVRNHIKAITRRWMDPYGDGDLCRGVDGWRLDVPEEVGTPFWREWCSMVRQINPEAYITGEIWDEKAAGYLKGDLFNGVMNYQFAKAVQAFMIDRCITAPEFRDRLRATRESFPPEANYVVQNLMDSHDTPRLASMILNPGREYDTEGRPEEGFDIRKPDEHHRRIQKLIALFQFTYVGAPMIYYGTEAGMWGADDPDDRKPMLWPEMEYEDEKAHPMGEERLPDTNRFDRELYEWYRKLIGIRNEYEALQAGGFNVLEADAERSVFAFARHAEGEAPGVIIVLNRSEDEQTVALEAGGPAGAYNALEELISGGTHSVEEGRVELNLDPVSGAILIPKK